MQLRSTLPLLIAACIAGSVFADDLPKRKSGLWEIRTSSSAAGAQGGGATMQMCIDEKVDNVAQQQAAGMAKETCSKNEIKRSGNRMTIDSVCKFGESTATSHSVFTGSFDSAYRVETKSSYDPPMMGMKEGSVVMEAKWLGPCKADQRPGDMILGNGMKMNIYDTKGAPARK